MHTYANEHKLINYPFEDHYELPIPRGLISCFSVCITPLAENDLYDVRQVVVRSMEFGDRCVSITLSREPYGRCLGTVRTVPGTAARACSFRSEDGLYLLTAVVQISKQAAEIRGSYILEVPLDCSCVTLRPASEVPAVSSITVNRTAHEVPPVLQLSTHGWLDLLVSGRTIRLESSIPDDAVTCETSLPVPYDMVRSIDKIDMTSPRSAGRRNLRLRINNYSVPRLDPETGKPCTPPIVPVLSGNLLYDSKVTPDDERDPDWISVPPGVPGKMPDKHSERKAFGKSLHDDRGPVLTVTLVGNKDFKNCYDRKLDESSAELPKELQ